MDKDDEKQMMKTWWKINAVTKCPSSTGAFGSDNLRSVIEALADMIIHSVSLSDIQKNGLSEELYRAIVDGYLDSQGQRIHD